MEQISLIIGFHNNAFKVVAEKIMNQNVEYSTGDVENVPT